MALIGSTRRRLGDIWPQLAVSACVLMAPPLLVAAGLTYFGFPLTSAPQAVHAADGAEPRTNSIFVRPDVAPDTSFIVASAEGAASRSGASIPNDETTPSTSFNLQRRHRSQLPSSSGMRLASLEIPVNSGFTAEEIDPPALARRPSAFGDRLLPVERPDSFDQRFEGLAVWSTTGPAMIKEREEAAGSARPPSREKATDRSAIGRSPPKPAAASTLASAAKKTGSHGRSFARFASVRGQPYRGL
jgi:hypothetical protein